MNHLRHLAGLLVIGLGLSPLPALAAAVYLSKASSVFAIGAPAFVTAGTGSGAAKTEFGAGVATSAGVESPPGAAPATVAASAAGAAAAPPTSFASSEYKGGHNINIDRLLDSGITVAFSFSISWETDISVDHPALEVATAGAYFAISGIDNEAVTLDDPLDLFDEVFEAGKLIRYEFNPHRSTAFGELGIASGTATVSGTIVVPADTFSIVSVITDVAGSAGAVVPEPAPWLLVLPALLAVLGGSFIRQTGPAGTSRRPARATPARGGRTATPARHRAGWQ